MHYCVTIKPNSRKGPLIEQQSDGSLLVFVREPANEGKANTALIALLAAHFAIPKTRITILRGHTAKHKVVAIEATDSMIE